MRVEVKDYGFRRVVRVTVNDTEPKWMHGAMNPVTQETIWSAPTQPHSGDTEEAATLGVRACKLCQLNHRIEEFYWNMDEMVVYLNEWGNPVHDGQPAVSSRTKKWDELMAEVESGRGSSTGRRVVGAMPRTGIPQEAIPRLMPEVYPEFSTQPKDDAKMEGVVASQEFTVLHFGTAKATFTVQGTTRAEFDADKAAKLEAAKLLIQEEAAALVKAKAIAGA